MVVSIITVNFLLMIREDTHGAFLSRKEKMRVEPLHKRPELCIESFLEGEMSE